MKKQNKNDSSCGLASTQEWGSMERRMFSSCLNIPMLKKEHGKVGQKVRNSPGSHAGIVRRESEQGPAGSGVSNISHGNDGAESWGGKPQRQRGELCGERSHLSWFYCLFSTWDSAWYTVGTGEIFVKWMMNTLKKTYYFSRACHGWPLGLSLFILLDARMIQNWSM